MKISTALVAAAAQFASLVSAADTEAWKSRNIYFALTDRISTGSDGGACGDLGKYCGGTFAGLESKLDYIQGMGFDAIWITPIVENTEGGYHGYWAKDLYEVNSNYGTAEDLKSLIDAAHKKDIYFMVDVVVNHMGDGNISEFGPEPLNQESSYHTECEIDYNDENSVENCWIAGLPDINTQSEEVREALDTWITWLMKEYGFDGVRIDTVKHVERDFWPSFVSAAGAYTMGEVWDGDPEYLAGYAKLMGGLLDYSIYYPMNNFYQGKGEVGELVAMHDRVSSLFPDPAALATFMDNHDNARWLSQKNDVTLLKNCLAYVILSRGIPIVYYGTEQGYAGGNDPANREDLWRSGFDEEADLYVAISKLSVARKGAGGLAEDDQVHLHTSDPTAYAWSRGGGELIVLTMNRGSSFSDPYCFNTQVANGSWSDVFGSGTYSSDGEGEVCVDVDSGNPVVLVAA